MKSILITKIVFSWGYIIRPPYVSGGGYSLPYPPPSTLIGALAASYLRLKKPIEIVVKGRKPYSPAVEVLNNIVYYAVLGFREESVAQINDLTKHYIYAYLREEHKRNEKFWSAALGLGKTYAPREAYIVYIVSSEYVDEIAKTAWGINRIGSKEGLVAVKEVEIVYEPEIVSKEVVKTIFPTPKSIAECEENCTETSFWKLNNKAYTSFYPKEPSELLETYLVPSRPGGVYGGEMIVRPKPSESSIIKLQLDDFETYLVTPKNILG